MVGPRTISSGGTTAKDPADRAVYVFDWDRHLGVGVTITDSTFTLEGPDNELTSDQETVLDGSRSARIRLSAGTLGATYRVHHRIVTNENPAQTKERSFFLLVKDL